MISTDQLSRRIISRLAEVDNPTRHDVERIKLEVCGEFNVERIPRNSEILANLLPSEMRLHKILKRKLVRSISGVAIVAVMTPPSRCPHENAPCVYCPGGPGSRSSTKLHWQRTCFYAGDPIKLRPLFAGEKQNRATQGNRPQHKQSRTSNHGRNISCSSL